MSLPIVAVVGRPNVGKSTFVNRIMQGQDAIVHSSSGVTRDRSYHKADWNGVDFMLIDTGGIDLLDNDAFGPSIRAQAMMAADQADIVIFLVDGKAGVASGDADVAKLLRKSGRPIFLVVNKADTPGNDSMIHEFWALGLGQPWAVSALHGHGTGDLLDEIVSSLPETEPEPEIDAINVAIIGRPNAGKSSLFNKLLGHDRSIVSEVAGTTRDALDTLVEHDGVMYRLVDTAGLRRKSQIDESVEYYSFVRAMRAIDRADVAVLVIDSPLGITDQDQRVARFAAERGSAMVVVLNKWDIVGGPEIKEEVSAVVPEKLGFIGYAPVLRISALTGSGTHKIFPAIHQAYTSFTQTITTSALNRFLTEIRAIGHTISQGRKTLRLNYVTQTGNKPPVFSFFANHPDLVDDSYTRYLENRMRETFDLTGTPVRIRFRKKA